MSFGREYPHASNYGMRLWLDPVVLNQSSACSPTLRMTVCIQRVNRICLSSILTMAYFYYKQTTSDCTLNKGAVPFLVAGTEYFKDEKKKHAEGKR